MATSVSGINVGDAVLSFLADTTNIDQALARLQTDVAAKLKPSGDAVAGLGKGFTDAGNAASDAGTKIAGGVGKAGDSLKQIDPQIKAVNEALKTLGIQGPEQLKAKLEEAKAAFSALKNAGVEAKGTLVQANIRVIESEIAYQKAIGQSTVALEQEVLALRGVTRSAAEAKGEIGLLGEATGVVLPRHVRGFVASLPGVGAALEAAFAATAVLFLIDAVITAGEKIAEFEDKPRKIEVAWREVTDATAEAGKTMEESLTAAQAKIIGLTQGPLAAMDYQILHIGSDAEKVAGMVGTIGAALVKALQEQDTSKFNLLSFFLPNSRDVSEQAQRFVAQLQSAFIQLGNQGGLVLLKSQIQDVDAQMARTAVDVKANTEKIGTAIDILEGRRFSAALEVSQSTLDSLTKYKASLLELQKIAEQGAELDKANKEAAALERRRQQGELLAAEAKRDLDADLANIAVKQSAEHLAFVSGETDAATWAVAQLNATDAATAVHERYLRRLVDIYKQSGDVVKSQATAQELATAQVLEGAQKTEALAAATQKYHETTLQILKDWQNLQNASVAKNFEEAQKAAERLTIEEIKLGEAQKKLQETQIKSDFSAQEQGIQNLANFGVISEQQKAERLRVLYQQEENAALSALRDLLAKEAAAVNAAQAKFDAAKSNPLLSDAQVMEAQSNLDRLKVAYTNTEAEILSTESTFEQKRIAVQQGAVAKAIALAQAEGRGKLAAALVYKQSVLDSINEDLASEKARLKDASATDEQRKALLLLIAAKQKERGQAQAAIRDLVAEANALKKTSAAMVEWKNVGIQASQDFGAAMNSAMAAIVSGQESFGKALEGVVFDVISKLAQHWADYFFALAAGYFAAQDYAHGAEATAAAIGLELLAGAFSGLASLTAQSSSGSSGTTSAGAQGPGQVSPTQTPQQPVQTVNAQRLARGGFAEKRTPVWIGDGENGGDAPEAVIPLNDDRATSRIAAALLRPMQFRAGLLSASTVSVIRNQTIGSASSQPASSASGEQRLSAIENAIERIAETAHGDIHNWNVHGLISGKDLETVALQVGKKLNRKVQKGNIRFNASNSQRVTRKG